MTSDKITLPLTTKHSADVVVAGGGPAGVAAALCAARAGADTVLIERSGALGGMWTSGTLGWTLDHRSTPVSDLLASRLTAADMGRITPFNESAFSFYPEAMKCLLDDVCAENGVKVRFYTQVIGGTTDDKRLTQAFTASKSGIEAWTAGVFIDATGDGDLAAATGCGFDIGAPDGGGCQPMSLLGLLSGVRFDDIREYVAGYAPRPERVARFLKLLQDQGFDPSYRDPSIFHLQDDLFCYMGNHIYGRSGLSADDLSAGLTEARRELFQQVEAIRKNGGVWAGLRVVASAEQLGVRETRRIHGHYTVTLDDILTGRRHADAVCQVKFGIDVHARKFDKVKAIEKPVGQVLPYDIPIRALISCDLDNLLMAGRCISGDFYAHSSYRVMGNVVPMGEAAGVLAALAVRNKSVPLSVPFEQVCAERERIDWPGVR